MVSDLKSRNYIRDLEYEISKLNSENIIDSIDHCPFHRIASSLIHMEKPTKAIVKRAISGIEMLAKAGFTLVKKEMHFYKVPGQLAHALKCSAFHLAAEYGNLDLIKAFVKIGADPLAKMHSDGQTIIHHLQKMLDDTSCPEKFASDYDKTHLNPAIRRKVEQVLDHFLQITGFRSAFDVPYAPTDMEINNDYLEKMMEAVGNSSILSIPIQMDDEIDCSTGCECHQEIGKVLHPKASALLEQYDYGEQDMVEQMEEAVKMDRLDAERCIHPDGAMKKFSDMTLHQSSSDYDDDWLSDELDDILS